MPDVTTPIELLRGLAVFAEPPTPEHEVLAELLGLPSVPSSSEYCDVFLFQLYPYASVHLGEEGMLGGDARERVAGFWTALGYTPPAEPDHLAALLGLVATLAERELELEGAEVALARQSRNALLAEHLAPWVFAYLDRVRELTDGPYHCWAETLYDLMRQEVERGDQAEVLPLHLRLAPPLSDPRSDGAKAFLDTLLAPVRSGVLITRADLGRIASELDLGLRAGERRYALEHLLAQAAAPVLIRLADEARRQGGLHRSRSEWLGPVADFHAGRAEGAAALLEELANEDDEAASGRAASVVGDPV